MLSKYDVQSFPSKLGAQTSPLWSCLEPVLKEWCWETSKNLFTSAEYIIGILQVILMGRKSYSALGVFDVAHTGTVYLGYGIKRCSVTKMTRTSCFLSDSQLVLWWCVDVAVAGSVTLWTKPRSLAFWPGRRPGWLWLARFSPAAGRGFRASLAPPGCCRPSLGMKSSHFCRSVLEKWMHLVCF